MTFTELNYALEEAHWLAAQRQTPQAVVLVGENYEVMDLKIARERRMFICEVCR